MDAPSSLSLDSIRFPNDVMNDLCDTTLRRVTYLGFVFAGSGNNSKIDTYFAKGKSPTLSAYSTSSISFCHSLLVLITVYFRMVAGGRIPISNENTSTFRASFIAIRASSWNPVTSAAVAKA